MVTANCMDRRTSGCFEVLVKERKEKRKKRQYRINDKACNAPHVLAWKPEQAAASLGLTSPSPSRLSEMDRPPNSRTPLRSPALPQLCEPFSWTGADADVTGSVKGEQFKSSPEWLDQMSPHYFIQTGIKGTVYYSTGQMFPRVPLPAARFFSASRACFKEM